MRLREAPPGLVNDATFNELVRALAPLVNLMVQAPLYADWTPGAVLLRLGRIEGRWLKITGATALGDNKWEYAAQPVRNAGLGGHAASNWVADGAAVVAYNLVEVGNDGAGVEGNGVDVDNMATGMPFEGFAIQPVPTGIPVRGYEVELVAGGSEWWFAYENGVDGECPE